ncbi:MAG: cytochrome b N-terminal domain-containing protein [Planctomycetota bacterium]
MIRAVGDWLDSRTGYRDLMHEVLFESVPGGARWRYVWGSTLVFTFFLQVVTGIFLWTAYSPSTQTAWESVYYIQHEMFLGDLVRGMHHFAAQVMVVLLAIHLIQVIYDGAYRAPREVNFWVGMVLAQIVLGLALTGYLLPWDQKGYYATQVSTKIAGATPLIGPAIQELAQGGPVYGHHTLTRFFAMHAGILPALMVVFITIHIYVFRRHGLTVADYDHAPDTTFWPDQVLKDAVACLGVLAVILLLAIFKGAELSAPANPAEAYAAARPEWYFLFLFRFLKFELVEHFGIAFGAIYVPGAIMLVLLAMPIIAAIFGGAGHRFNVAFLAVLSLAIVGLTGLALVEDATNRDHQAAIAEAHRDAERVVELAQGTSKIPVAGAATLLQADPFTQGPRLFAQHCASCHRYHGHDGRGRIVMTTNEAGESEVALPTAADLGNFASRDWMRAVLVDYTDHFLPIEFSNRYKASVAGEDDRDYINPQESEMANWSGDHESLVSEENAENLKALIEFLVAEANHPHQTVDAALVEQGRAVALDGAWNGMLEGTSCIDCHDTLGEPFEENPDGSGSGYPDLAAYGSAEWLLSFINNPGTDQHYGEKNQMPAFADKMSASERQMLIDWMIGNHELTDVHDYPSSQPQVQAAIESAVSADAER